MSVPYKPAKVIHIPILSPGEEQIRNGLKAKIAERIRRELVCCDIYDQFQRVSKESSPVEGARYMKEHRGEYQNHSICYWGECSARIAEEIDTYDG